MHETESVKGSDIWATELTPPGTSSGSLRTPGVGVTRGVTENPRPVFAGTKSLVGSFGESMVGGLGAHTGELLTYPEPES